MHRSYLKQIADIETSDNDDQAPLHDDACKDNTEFAELLLKHKADVKARNEENWITLHYCIWRNIIAVRHMLLQPP